ncbi:hypothetical protein Hte_007951 [Hypoxylon texense]
MQVSSSRHIPAPSSEGSPALRTDALAPGAGPGYLGPTSYYSMIKDAENSLLLLQGHDGTTSQSESFTSHASVEGSRDIMSPRVREMCLAALHNIPDPSRGVSLRVKQGSDGWIRPVAMRAARSLYESYGEYFVNRSDERLEELARKFCVNTSRPFSDDEADPERWVGQFLGENMRWELLGLLTMFWDFAPPGKRTAIWTGKRTAGFDLGFRISRETLHLCLDICKEFAHGNSMMLYLTQRCTVMDSKTVGDARKDPQTAAFYSSVALYDKVVFYSRNSRFAVANKTAKQI